MPLVRIDMIEGRSPEQIKARLDANHRALLAAFKVPTRRYDQVLDGHNALPDADAAQGITRDGAQRARLQHKAGDSDCWRTAGGHDHLRSAPS